MRDWTPHILLSITLACGPFCVAGSSPPLPPLALLARCYSHLTQRRLPLHSPLRERVENGGSPVDACLSLLDGAELQTSGPDEGKLVTDTPESRAVLATMNDFHRSWFGNADFTTSVAFGALDTVHQDQLLNPTEPALHVTRALLSPGVPFQEVAIGNSSMEALRTGGPVENNGALGFQFVGGKDGKAVLNTQLVQHGVLVGIRKITRNPKKNGAAFQPALAAAGGSGVDLISVHKAEGGVMGTRVYLDLNLGRPDVLPMNGGVRQARRWAKAVFKDLLCRSLPVIRLKDAIPHVTPAIRITSKTPPFRKGESCMACHASMDSMAGVARNFSYVLNGADGSVPQYNKTVTPFKWTVTQPVELGVMEDDPLFHLRPPTGTFLFRTYTGELIKKPVTGIADLGREIAATDDFYACAASRYFELFTGVSVGFSDPNDPGSPTASALDTKYRDFIIQLGRTLRDDQDLKNLVRRIFNSAIYQSTSLGASSENGGG